MDLFPGEAGIAREECVAVTVLGSKRVSKLRQAKQTQRDGRVASQLLADVTDGHHQACRRRRTVGGLGVTPGGIAMYLERAGLEVQEEVTSVGRR